MVKGVIFDLDIIQESDKHMGVMLGHDPYGQQGQCPAVDRESTARAILKK